MPQLGSDAQGCIATIDKLLDLHQNTGAVEVRYRKMIAEIEMLRLFFLLENTFKAITCKLLCGANYLDGSSPLVLLSCRSLAVAVAQMENHARVKRHDLKWTGTSDIKENVRYMLDWKDHLVRVLDSHGSFIAEMRAVRNRIAHNNPKARVKYRDVVRRHYGAFVNSATPGTLLISPRRAPALIEQYLLKSRVLVKELVRAKP